MPVLGAHRKYYDVLLLLGAVLYPLWWIPMHFAIPPTNDRLADRIIIGFFIFFCRQLIIYKNCSYRAAEKIFFLCSLILTLHMFYVGYITNLDTAHVVALFVTVFAIGSALHNKRQLTVYSVCCCVLIALVTFSTNSSFPKEFFLLGLYTSIFVLYISSYGKIESYNKLVKINNELKSSRILLQSSEKKLIEAQKISHIGNFEINISTQENYCSAETLKILEIESRILNPTLEQYLNAFHPEERDFIRNKFYQAQEDGCFYSIDARIPKANGEIKHVNIQCQPERSITGQVSILKYVIADITDRVKAQLLIREQQQQIIQASKMSALGEMAGGIAHEINNPLAVIHGRAGQLKEMAESSSLKRETVAIVAEKIESTAIRIAKIVKSLRTFARDGNNDEFQLANIKTLISDTLELCKEKFKNHSILLEVSPIPENIEIECRSVQIGQVLINLLSNSYDATDILDEKWIKINVEDSPFSVTISVTDSGNGIPLENREKLFQPFFTSKDIGKGTGLGLTISKGLIESHGGQLYVDYNSKNTKFVMMLPKKIKKLQKAA